MTTLTLQPDGTAGKDCQITSASPTFNNGVNTTLIGSNVTRGLVEFDLSSIPATATCDSATLSIYQSNSGAAGAWTITVRQIAIGNTSWIEGTRNNVQALAGEPCWNALAANGSGGVTTAWAGSAGLATATTDYETPNIGTTMSGDRSNANGTEYTSTLTPARVQGWFGASNTNHGLILQPSATVGGIASSDNATAAWRPKLVVNYTDALAPITGTAVITLDACTFSATGALAIAATASVTLGALTLASTGQLALSGQLTATLAALTLAATGAGQQVGITGAASITLGDVTLSSLGVLVIVGAATITLGSIVLIASERAPVIELAYGFVYGAASDGVVVGAMAQAVVYGATNTGEVS